jgi:hypothetical protein
LDFRHGGQVGFWIERQRKRNPLKEEEMKRNHVRIDKKSETNGDCFAVPVEPLAMTTRAIATSEAANPSTFSAG